jgi:PiT family inorganic phosphate transporter
MALLSIALVVLVFTATMLVAGNNLSACVGPAVGSRIVTRRFGSLLGAAGFATGLLVQGATMTSSFGILLPNATPTLRVEALLVAIIVFSFAFRFHLPMSLNMSLVGLLAGISLAQNNPANGDFVNQVALTWIVVPPVAVAFAFCLIRLLNRWLPTNFWHRLQTYKILLIVMSFSTAYVTGANTLGMIVATGGFDAASVIAAVAAVFVGSFFLAEGAIRRVSQEFFVMRYANAVATLITSTILVEVATFFNIPLSITQTTSAAVLGAGISYKTKLVSLKPFLKVFVGWVIAPLLSFGIGFLLIG